jgi:histidine triad (HIT) family protein
MEKNCLFCKIIRNEIPAQKVFENDSMVIIKDISPQAPYHYLGIPKEHYPASTIYPRKNRLFWKNSSAPFPNL